MDIDCKDFNFTSRSHQVSSMEVVEHLGPGTNPPDEFGVYS